MARRFDRILKKLSRKEDMHFFEDPSTSPPRLRLIARIAMRFFWVYVIVLLLGLVSTLGAGMDIYHRTEMPQFCGVCHEMGNNFGSWEVSLHKSIKCVDCHTRPGLSGWLQAKLSGTRQLFTHMTAASIDDIHVNAEQRQMVSSNCKRCHAGSARLQEIGGLKMAHERHLEIGIECVQCHSRAFAHPERVSDEEDWTPPAVNEMDCFRCHDGKSTFGDAKAFATSSEANCDRCHPDAKIANNHGREEQECNYCHEAKGDEEHFSVRPEDVAEICSNCHDDLADDHESQHKPFADGSCSDCHHVMSPAHLFNGRSAPSVAGCLSCHEEMEELLAGDEAVGPGKFSDGAKDLHLAHQEHLGDKQAWCLKCHDSHGSPAAIAMLKLRPLDSDKPKGEWEASENGGTCTSECHEETSPVEYHREPERPR